MVSRNGASIILWTSAGSILLCILLRSLSSIVIEHGIKDVRGRAKFSESSFDQFRDHFMSNLCLPRRIHLSQAGDAINGLIDMTISFSIDFRSCRQSLPTVMYGTGSTYRNVSASNPHQFNFTSSSAFYESDWIFHVRLKQLLLGEVRYWYRIIVQPHAFVDGAGLSRNLEDLMNMVSTSPTLSFRTPPLPGSPTTIALVGDLGQTQNSIETMSKILRGSSDALNRSISLLLVAGDMSYADSNPWRWEAWFDLMEPLLRAVPVHVAAGNHEIECDEETRDIFVPYENWFRNPNRIGPANTAPVDDDYRKTLWHRSCSTPSQFIGHYDFGNAFYAFQHGLAKFIVLSSYSNTSVGSVQYNWLEQELRAVNRSVLPWLIVSFHCPFYTTFKGHENEIQV